MFEVSKYHYLQKICYKFEWRTVHDDYAELNVGGFPVKFGQFWRSDLLVLQQWTTSHALDGIAAYVHQKDSAENVDVSAATDLILSSYQNLLRISFHTLEIRKLKPPYDTKCHQFPRGVGVAREKYVLDKIQSHDARQCWTNPFLALWSMNRWIRN